MQEGKTHQTIANTGGSGGVKRLTGEVLTGPLTFH